MTKEEKVLEIIKRLYKIWPEPRTALEYTTPWELLVATILSAQATDKLVNTVTPSLFAKYKTPADFAKLTVEEIDAMISKINFHGNKAKSLKGAAEMIMERHNGQVPRTMQDLDELPGVARKTANVVMSNAFKTAEGIAVDTHIMRQSKLLGLSTAITPEKVEIDLMRIVPKEYWIDFPHLLINYGREYSPSRGPKPGHPLEDLYI